jgi:hypothetical protein
MNYESASMSPDEMVEATYDAGLTINRVKGEAGIIDATTVATTEKRIGEARVAMRRIDEIMDGPLSARDSALWGLKEEFERLSESTVCEKKELNWPRTASVRHVAAAVDLLVRESAASLMARRRGEWSPASSNQHPRPAPPQPVIEAPEG